MIAENMRGDCWELSLTELLLCLQLSVESWASLSVSIFCRFLHQLTPSMLTRYKGTVTIFQYGAGPNGVMRTLGKYMLGSGGMFGYALAYFLRCWSCSASLANEALSPLAIAFSCPSAALFVPKDLTMMPGCEPEDPR